MATSGHKLAGLEPSGVLHTPRSDRSLAMTTSDHPAQVNETNPQSTDLPSPPPLRPSVPHESRALSESAVGPGLWDAVDVAHFLKVSRSWVYHQAQAGMLP